MQCAGLSEAPSIEERSLYARGLPTRERDRRRNRIDGRRRSHRTFLEKPAPDQIFSSWVNAGIMVCEPGIFDAIPAGFSDFGRNVLPELIRKGERIFAYRMDGENERLLWIDSLEDYERTKAAVQQWT